MRSIVIGLCLLGLSLQVSAKKTQCEVLVQVTDSVHANDLLVKITKDAFGDKKITTLSANKYKKKNFEFSGDSGTICLVSQDVQEAIEANPMMTLEINAYLDGEEGQCNAFFYKNYGSESVLDKEDIDCSESNLKSLVKSFI
jgi:hypothetical protein